MKSSIRGTRPMPAPRHEEPIMGAKDDEDNLADYKGEPIPDPWKTEIPGVGDDDDSGA